MPQSKTGVVVSAKMNKTVLVKVVTKTKHPFYKKQITKMKKFKAHDEIGIGSGKKVRIEETKPYAKDVHFKVVEEI